MKQVLKLSWNTTVLHWRCLAGVPRDADVMLGRRVLLNQEKLRDVAELAPVLTIDVRYQAVGGADAEDGGGRDDLDAALLTAVHDGKLDETSRLLAQGAKLEARNEKGATAVHVASIRGNAEILRLLLDHGPDLSTSVGEEKVTALHLAAFTGSVDCVQHLLSAGAKTFVQSANGDAPLAVATAQGHLGVVSALLDSRAWVDQFNEKGMTALHVACAKGHVELVARLMAANASSSLPAMDVGTPVDLAIALGRVDCLRVLIDHGATDDMSSLLLLAIQAGRTEVIRFLIEAGANIHCIDAMGSTALHVAFKPGATENLELVRFLLDNGLDVNAPDIGGMTPLHAAAICGLPNSVRFLLEAGAHMSCGPEVGVGTRQTTPPLRAET